MPRRLSAFALTTLLTPLPAVGVGHPGSPAAVSPADGGRLATVTTRCPTFSWGQVPGADRYELVVYRVAEGRPVAAVLRQEVAGGAGSWTPTQARCLERGGRYAWSVRARHGGSPSDWSAPALFRVAEGPSVQELKEVLAVLRRHGAGGAGTGDAHRRDHGDQRRAGESPDRSDPGRDQPVGRGTSLRGDAAELGLGIEGRVEAAAFVGDGSALANVEAAGLTCAGCVGPAELAAGAVTAASIGEACASGQVLMRGGAGWECATLTGPACLPGDEVACYTGPAGTRGVGECAGGTRLCVADSTWGPCSGEVTPAAAEACDGLDNTCDGAIDQGDPATLCPLTANVTATLCDAAACVVASCEALWADADGEYANGCEAPAAGHCLDDGVPRPIVAPGEGELVIREYLADPASPLSDAAGEWFEVAVHAGVDLNELGIGTVFGTVVDTIEAAGCLTAAPGEVLLFARSADPAANGGLTPHHLFGFSLVNGGGDLHLAHGGNLVDAVAWDAGDLASGRARSLPAALESSAANDDPASWCNVPADPTLLYADGNHGTPSVANVDCP